MTVNGTHSRIMHNLGLGLTVNGMHSLKIQRRRFLSFFMCVCGLGGGISRALVGGGGFALGALWVFPCSRRLLFRWDSGDFALCLFTVLTGHCSNLRVRFGRFQKRYRSTFSFSTCSLLLLWGLARTLVAATSSRLVPGCSDFV